MQTNVLSLVTTSRVQHNIFYVKPQLRQIFVHVFFSIHFNDNTNNSRMQRHINEIKFDYIYERFFVSSFHWGYYTRNEFLTKRFVWSCAHNNESKIQFLHEMPVFVDESHKKRMMSISVSKKHDWNINICISAFRLPLDIPIYIITVKMPKSRCHSAFAQNSISLDLEQ